MKRLLALSKLAMAAALVAFVSCQKENTDPEPEPEPEPSTEFVCEHNTLEYVEAVKRTGKTAGNVAHWHCNNCNRNFLDAGTTKEIVNAYLPATNYCIDSEILNRIQHIYPFVPASEQTKGEDGLIPSAVTLFHHKIQEYKFREFSKALFTELNEINEQLALIESQVEEIQKQNAAILAKVEDTPYSDDVDQLFNVGKFIWEQSYRSFENVMTEYSRFDRGEITETQLAQEIKGICLDWNNFTYGGDHTYALTTRYIEQFSGYKTDRGVTMTCPQIFHHFNSDYRLWDNEGYTDRKQMDIEAETVLSLGYFMASLYRDNTKIYGYDGNRKQDSLALSGYYDKIEPLVLNDIENMQKAYDKYRYFHNGTTEMVIDKSAVIVNSDYFAQAICYNDFYVIHWRNKSSVQDFYKRFNTLLDGKYSFGYSNGTTLAVEDYTTILNSYSNGNIFDILHNDAKIDRMPATFHEKGNVEGSERTLVMRYYSNKADNHSYEESACSYFYHGGVWRWVGLEYREFYFDNYNCGCWGTSNMSYIKSKEMNEKCACGDYVEMAPYLYTGGLSSKSSSDPIVQISGKHSDWKSGTNAQVFLKKYTGTIVDPLD